MELEVKKFSKTDIDKLVSLHMKIFPDYFLTNLGADIIKFFYLWFDNDKTTQILIIQNKNLNTFIGFAMVTGNYDNIYSSFNKNYFSKVFIELIKGILTLNKVIVKGLFFRFLNIFSSSDENYDRKYSLVSLGVDPDCQGNGIGKKLINNVDEFLAINDVKEYSLSVKKDNDEAIIFYERVGFSKIGESKELFYYGKNTK